MSVRAPSDLDKRLGARLSHMRKAAGLTPSDLADKLDITYQQLYKYEKGQNRIAASTLIKIAEILGVEPSSFFDMPTVVKDSRNFQANLDIVILMESMTAQQRSALVNLARVMRQGD